MKDSPEPIDPVVGDGDIVTGSEKGKQDLVITIVYSTYIIE